MPFVHYENVDPRGRLKQILLRAQGTCPSEFKRRLLMIVTSQEKVVFRKRIGLFWDETKTITSSDLVLIFLRNAEKANTQQKVCTLNIF
jgi:hypothetical protein